MVCEGRLRCLSICTVILIVIFWILGGAIFGISLWARLDFWSKHYVDLGEELEKYFIVVYILIVCGGLIMLFGFIGCIGVVRLAKWAIVTYLAFLVFLFVLQLAGIGVGYVYREEIAEKITQGRLVQYVVVEDYGVNKTKTIAMDFLQAELKCCGGSSYTDYTSSTWQRSLFEERKNMAPISCCKDYYRYQDYRYCAMFQDNIHVEIIDRVPNENINKLGCGAALVKFFKDHIAIIAGIATAILILELLAVFLLSCILHVARKIESPMQDEVVYEMARAQEKAPYPTRGGAYSNI